MYQLPRGNVAILFLGDIFVFTGALLLTLTIRYQEWPSDEAFGVHFIPFLTLFVIWAAVFLIAGLYDTNVSLTRKRIPELVVRAQIINMLLAGVFFFVFPVGITPKTTLALYLIVSTILVAGWRLFVFPRLTTRRALHALIFGSGQEPQELAQALNSNPYFQFIKAEVVDTSSYSDFEELRAELVDFIDAHNVQIIIGDTRDQYADALVPLIFDLTFKHRNLSFINFHKLYEQIFYRVPLGRVSDQWVLENVSTMPHYVYDAMKRCVDIIGALVLGVLTLPLYPVIVAAIKFDDGGSVFYFTERVGQYNRPIRMIKFRTMSGQDRADEALRSVLRVTRVGLFLRTFRIDEIPQLLNILLGDLSFVGPRPEMPALAGVYAREISYYNVRHLIKPGLSGWAQIYHDRHPHHGTDIIETANKLSFDLYYLKHRSFLLDIEIALKTIKIVLSRSGA